MRDQGMEPQFQSEDRRPAGHRRRWALSIRGLMILVLAIGSLLGWYGGKVREQREIVSAIRKAGGEVGYDWQTASSPNVSDLVGSTTVRPTLFGGRVVWPRWLVNLAGIDAFGHVDKVWFTRGQAEISSPLLAQIGKLRKLEILWVERSIDSAGLIQLSGLSRLKVLELWKAHGPSSDISWLRGMTQLEMLHLGAIPVRDDDLVALRPLIELRSLLIRSPHITDAGLAHLAGLTRLESLILKGTSVRGPGLAHLSRMRSLETLAILKSSIATLDNLPALPIRNLCLPFTAIDDHGLARIRSMPTVDLVIMDGTRITDSGLESLAAHPRLSDVHLYGTGVTPSGASAFQAEHPRCAVRYGPVQSSPYYLMP